MMISLVFNIVGNAIFLRPFDIAHPTNCIEEGPATKAGLRLNSSNTHFVRTFEYTTERIRDVSRVLRYNYTIPLINPSVSGW